MKKTLLTLLLLLCFQATQAQDQPVPEEEKLETDRPSKGDAAKVVPQGKIQVEAGLQFENDETNSTSDKEFHLPETLIRYGLLNFAEVRIRAQFTRQVLTFSGNQGQRDIKESGFDDFMLGTKIKLLENQGWRPDAALQADFNLPIGSDALQGKKVEPKLRLNFKNKLTESLSLHYNLGVEWEENENLLENQDYNHIGLYALALQYQITQNFMAFAEAFGEKHENDMRQSLDFGLAYKALPNLQFDGYAGFGLSEEAPDYFISGGVSFRLPE